MYALYSTIYSIYHAQTYHTIEWYSTVSFTLFSFRRIRHWTQPQTDLQLTWGIPLCRWWCNPTSYVYIEILLFCYVNNENHICCSVCRLTWKCNTMSADHIASRKQQGMPSLRTRPTGATLQSGGWMRVWVWDYIILLIFNNHGYK